MADTSDTTAVRLLADDPVWRGMAEEIQELRRDNERLRAWIEAIGSLPDVDVDARGWMARDALEGKEISDAR